MRKFLFVLAVLTLFVAAMPARAQEEVRLSSVSVNLWPEYDQAAVLVIYHITLAPETTLPATLKLHVPLDALVNAVAALDPVNGLVNAQYSRTVEDEWALLEITVTALQVQVEYYDILQKVGSQRSIVFEWAGDYALGTIEVNFLEPPDSRNVQISPAPVESALNGDGLMNHIIWADNNLAEGQPYIVNISYERDTDEVTVASQQVEPVVTPGEATAGYTAMTDVLPWLLAGLGVLLLAASVTGLIAWQKGERGTSGRKRHAPRPVKAEEPVYCSRCGKRAQSGDVFCRTCGSRLTNEE